jgi:hypothetical protein
MAMTRSKQKSIELLHSGSTCAKALRVRKTAENLLASIFLDQDID